MLNKNSMLTGALAALIFPAIAFVTPYLLKNNIIIINRPALPYFIAVALNLIIMRFAFKKDLDRTGKGIILATFVCMLVVFILKIHPIR